MNQAQLSSIDLIIVVLYIVGTTLLGVWFSRRQTDLKTYFVGDRNVAWWLVLISIVATETSTVTFLSVPGLSYSFGNVEQGIPTGNMTFLQLAFGYILGRIVIAWLFLPQYMRGELFSAYQLLRQRFDSTVQRTASGLFLLTRTIADGLRLYLTALLLQQFTGWNVAISILVMGGVTLLYTYLGGMQAVIWTDLIQFVIYILGAVLAGWFILDLLHGGWTGFRTFGEATSRFQVIDWSTDWSRPYTIWAGVIGGAVVTMASHGADQLMVQRYLCSRSLGEARLALISSGFVVLIQFLLFLLIGVGLAALRQSGELPIPAGMKNDQVFGFFIVNQMPRGLIGFVIAAVLAAAMSTLSSSLNSSANALVSDFYRPLSPTHSDSHYLRVSKVMTFVWGIAQVSVALAAHALGSQESVINQVMTVAAFVTGLILGLFILGILGIRIRSSAALIGLVGGFTTVVLVWLPASWLPARQVWQSLGLGGPLAWPWLAVVGSLSTTMIALVANAFGSDHVSRSATNGSPKPGLD